MPQQFYPVEIDQHAHLHHLSIKVGRKRHHSYVDHGSNNSRELGSLNSKSSAILRLTLS